MQWYLLFSLVCQSFSISIAQLRLTCRHIYICTSWRARRYPWREHIYDCLVLLYIHRATVWWWEGDWIANLCFLVPAFPLPVEDDIIWSIQYSQLPNSFKSGRMDISLFLYRRMFWGYLWESSIFFSHLNYVIKHFNFINTTWVIIFLN